MAAGCLCRCGATVRSEGDLSAHWDECGEPA